LADRKNPHGLSGQVFVDGYPPPPSFKYIVGYVVQDDIISGTLTVRENLMFSANVRLPNDVSDNERRERVTKLIHDLGLESCANTKIGNEFLRGVSGGERKRTCIGMELVLSPKILFLDEPTTGLYCVKFTSVSSNCEEHNYFVLFMRRTGCINSSKCYGMSQRTIEKWT
jgi:ATP-binding cassette subfamily G (WHITE) protein 2